MSLKLSVDFEDVVRRRPIELAAPCTYVCVYVRVRTNRTGRTVLAEYMHAAFFVYVWRENQFTLTNLGNIASGTRTLPNLRVNQPNG